MYCYRMLGLRPSGTYTYNACQNVTVGKIILPFVYKCHLLITFANGVDTDQARHFVGPDLSPNCLQRLLADGTSRQELKLHKNFVADDILPADDSHEISSIFSAKIRKLSHNHLLQ